MALPSLNQIEPRRKRLDLSQSQLASLAGISRSSLTKIEFAYRELRQGERPSYVPNFEDGKRLLEVLEAEEAKRRTGIMNEKVGKVAHNPVKHVSPDDQVGTAKNLMKQFDYSQLPVMKGEVCVGRITDAIIVEVIERVGSLEKVYESPVGSMMGQPLPIVGGETLLSSIMPLLKEQKAVLVVKNGKTMGIITAFDVLA